MNGGVAIGTYAGVDTAPTEGLIVSGLVGAGTIAPQSTLHIANSTYSSAITDYGLVTFDTGSATAGTGGSGIAIGWDGTAGWSWIYSRTNGVAPRPLIFGGYGIGYSAPLYISGANVSNRGLVGIGNTAPSATLDVYGTINAGTSSTDAILLTSCDPSAGAWIRNDGNNMVVSTNVGSLFLGYGGNTSNNTYW